MHLYTKVIFLLFTNCRILCVAAVIISVQSCCKQLAHNALTGCDAESAINELVNYLACQGVAERDLISIKSNPSGIYVYEFGVMKDESPQRGGGAQITFDVFNCKIVESLLYQ